MSSVDYVEQAGFWARELTRMKSRTLGDTKNAMRTIEREYGVEFQQLWRLRYRRGAIKDIGCKVFDLLREAYGRECERQMHRLSQELEITKAKAGTTHPAVAAAEAVVAADRHSD